MFTILPGRYPHTIAIEINGKATEEDAEKLDHYVKANYKEGEDFNLFIKINDIDGTTLKGLVDGIKFDAKHWSQFKKIAVLSEKNWIEKAAELWVIAPGITTKHFTKEQEEEAWNWLA